MAGKEGSFCVIAGWLAGNNSSEERAAAVLFTDAEPEKQVEHAGWDNDSQEKGVCGLRMSLHLAAPLQTCSIPIFLWQGWEYVFAKVKSSFCIVGFFNL